MVDENPEKIMKQMHRRAKRANKIAKLLGSRTGDLFLHTILSRKLREYTKMRRGDAVEHDMPERTLTPGERNINCSTITTSFHVSPPIEVKGVFPELTHILRVEEYKRSVDILDAEVRKTAKPVRAYWSTMNYYQRHVAGPYASPAAKIFRSKNLVQLPYPQVLRKPVRVSVEETLYAPAEPGAEPRGELDLYPEKVQLSNNCWLVTTYGRHGDTKTETTVGVDGSGNVQKVENVKLTHINSNGDVDIEAESDENCFVKVKIQGIEECDHYYVFKALETMNGYPCIAVLQVPASAKVAITKFETKARCSEATVVAIWEFATNAGEITYTKSIGQAHNFVYRKKQIQYTVGDVIRMDRIDEICMQHDATDRDACAPGIHFCFSQEDALRFHHCRVEKVINPEALMAGL